jgi:hypothetical protein
MLNIRKFLEGLRIIAKTTLVSDTKGELEVEDSSGKLNYHNGSSRSPVVTESHAATITNKTLTSPVINTGVSGTAVDTDGTLAANSDTLLASQKAVKTYVTASSGAVQTDVDDLVTLSGRPANSTDLGTFTGTTIPDASTNKSALQALETGLEAHIADATDAHAGSAITNTPAGTIAATTVQAAINELDGDVQTVQTNLTNHINDTTDAHAGTAITNTPAGTIAATTVQAAINELDGDIQAHISDAVDAHDASAISVVPTGNLAATEVQAALVEHQGDIDTINVTSLPAKVTGPASATDEAVVRYDSTTGKLVQNSVVTITDAGIAAGLTGLTSSGTVTASGTMAHTGSITDSFSTDSATTGANAAVSSPTTPAVRLTNASLTSIDTIASPVAGRVLTVVNHTGAAVTINNDTGGTAANRILTGTKAPIQLADEASLILKYDSTESRWLVIGGTGSAAGTTDVDIMAVQNFQNATLTDFTQTGMSLDTTTQIHGTTSAKMTHQAGVNQSFKQVIAVDPKFRGAAMTVSLVAKSTASSGNVTILFRDETNAVDIQTSQQIDADSTIQTFQYGVTIPSTCLSFSYTITALPEAGSPVTYVDDIVIRNYWQGSALEGQTEYSFEVPAVTDWASYTPTFVGFGTPTGVEFFWRRDGANVEIKGSLTAGTSTGVTASFTLPTGLTASAFSVSTQPAGFYVRRDVVTQHGGVVISEPSTNLVYFGSIDTFSNGSVNPMSKALGNAVLGTGGTANIGPILIPIQDWAATETKTVVVNDLVPAHSMPANASIEIPTITDWASYTPTFTGFGTATGIEMQYRQNGQNVEIKGKFVAGTPTAVEARVSLPNSYTSASTSIIPSIQAVGSAYSEFSSTTFFGESVLIEPSVTYLTFGRVSSTTNGISAKATGDNIVATGGKLSFFASVPVAGLTATETVTWSATQSVVTAQADTTIRVDTANGFGSSGTKIRRFTNLRQNIGSDITYADSATNGATFTIVTSGVYNISYSETLAGTGFFGISKNASSLTTSIQSLSTSEILAITSTTTSPQAETSSWQGYLAAGDIIRPHTDAGAPSGSNQMFTISKQGSLSLVQTVADQKIKIPTSELRMDGASSRGAVATAIVKFDTLSSIRSDAFTVTSTSNDGTYITMTKAGKLDISTSLNLAANTFAYITKNQSSLVAAPSASEILAFSANGAGAANVTTCTANITVAVGDVLRVSCTGNPTSFTGNNLALLFQEQNVAVAVTNVLPQFSESDSSVRVDTANGFGSTNTKIRRFSNVRENIGTDIVYTDSSTNGSTFVVQSSGIYDISYSDSFTTADYLGISKNSATLTTNVQSLTQAERLVMNILSTNTGSASVSWQGYLAAGDIIRPHTGGTAASTGAVTFTMSKVGKPNVTGVNVTPFIEAPVAAITNWETFTPSGSFNTNTTYAGKYRRVGSDLEIDYYLTFSGVPNTTALTLTLPAGLVIDTASLANPSSTNDNTLGEGSFYDASATTPYHITAEYDTTTTIRVKSERVTASIVESAANQSQGTPVAVASGDALSLKVKVPIVGWDATPDTLLTPTSVFNTDTASLAYASSSLYTLSTLANAPIGTFITYTYAASGNVRTQTTTAPTQTTSSMNTNGIQLFPRAYNATSTAGNPTAIAIQIGKGLKGVSYELYKSTSKATAGELDFASNSTFSAQYGMSYKNYDALTGILYLDAAEAISSGNVTREFKFNDATTQASGYIVINASKNPALTGFGTDEVNCRATCTSGQSFGNGSTATIIYNNRIFDTHGAFNTSTGVYTVPVAGTYLVTINTHWAASTAWSNAEVTTSSIRQNGVEVANILLYPWATQASSVTVQAGGPLTILVRCAKGDTIDAQAVQASGGSLALNTNAAVNYISIALIK